MNISLEPGNLEKNQYLFPAFEKVIKEYLSRMGGNWFPKFEITDSNLSITILGFMKNRDLPP